MEDITLGGRYKIIEKVGGGGMAQVYKARCQLLNRDVAIKILRDEFVDDEEFVRKFRDESLAAGSLSHPNIVNVYDVGNEEIQGKKIYYIVMEYIEGVTLKDLIRKNGPLRVEDAVNYGIQIADALQHAHDNGIIHRDIKPHNIMITKDKRAKVTDFGIARAATSSTLTNTSSIIGSVHYFSPEQARGGYTDEKSDIYSLGIVLYEMLTGEVPYKGDTPVTVALKHIKEDIQAPSLINPSVPKELDSIVLKCTSKIQVDRYKQSKDVMNDLRKFKNNKLDLADFEDTTLSGSPTQIISPEDQELLANASSDKKPIKKKRSGFKTILLAIVLAFFVSGALIYGYVKVKDFLNVSEIEVPDLIGMEEEKAKLELEKLGLKLEVREREFNEDYQKGQIFYQDVKAGERVKKGYTIKVDVSKGINHVKVPNLVNRNINEVENILEEYKLKLGRVDYREAEGDGGFVLEQTPDAYSEVEEGSYVDIIVSKKAEDTRVEVPKLVGLMESEAKALVVSRGLALNKTENYSNDHVKGTVMSQSIEAGSKVEKNTTISVVISLGPKEEPEEKEPEPEPEEKEIPFNLELGLPEREDPIDIEIVRVQDGSKNTVYSQTIDKDKTSITVELTGKPSSSFEIYFNGNLNKTINHPN